MQSLKRAHANLLENLPAFLGIVFIAAFLDAFDQITAISAWTFVLARLTYFTVYGAGITLFALRTVFYFISLGAIATLTWRILAASGIAGA